MQSQNQERSTLFAEIVDCRMYQTLGNATIVAGYDRNGSVPQIQRLTDFGQLRLAAQSSDTIVKRPTDA